MTKKKQNPSNNMQKTKVDIAREVLLANPKITENRTIAKLVFSQNTGKFKDLEEARTAVRRAVGKHGVQCLQHSKHAIKSFTEKLAEVRALFPDEKRNEFTVEPYVFPKASKRALVISDIHVGHHNNKAIDIALEAGDTFKADTIIINGDVCDFPRLGRWLVKPSNMTVQDELIEIEKFFYLLRTLFPKQQIVFHAGNHDKRWNDYIIRNAADLFGLGFTELPEVLKLREKKIHFVKDTDWMEYGSLVIAHGHHIVKGMFAPVSPARGVQLKTFQSTIIGHLHRTSEHLWTNIQGKQYGTWSTGCLCDLRPEYNPQVAQANFGFALVEKDANGEFEVQNKKIINGKVR